MHVANLFCAMSRERANRDLDTEGGKGLKMRAKIQRVESFFLLSFKQRERKEKLSFDKIHPRIICSHLIIFKLYLNQVMPSGC